MKEKSHIQTCFQDKASKKGNHGSLPKDLG